MKLVSLVLIFLIPSTLFASTDSATAKAAAASSSPPGACVSVYTDCETAMNNAAAACSILNLDKYGLMITAAVAGTSVVGSLTKSCAKMDEVMKIANAGMAAYQANCALARNNCSNLCAAAPSRISGHEASMYMAAGACKPDHKRAAAMLGACEGMLENVAAAAASIIAIAAENDAAQNCKKKTTADATCTADSKDPKCFMDCSLPANASKAACICQRTPNAKGCAGAIDYNAGTGTMINPSVANENLNIPNPNLQGIGTSDAAGAALPGASALSGGGTGGSAGSDGGGGGGSQGFTGGGKGADATKKAAGKLNTDILSGIDGGGGGGGGGRGGSRGQADSPYQAYLPGGTKDPSRGVANVSSEVTSGGAKSNWQKINERYQQFRPTLNAGP